MQRSLTILRCRFFGGFLFYLFTGAVVAALLGVSSAASAELQARIRTSGVKTTKGPPFAFLLLDTARVPDADVVERSLVKWLATDAARPIQNLQVVQDIGEPIAISFEFDGRAFAAGLIDQPIPKADLDYACSNSFFWPDSRSALGRHSSHLIVTALGDYDRPWRRALRLSQVMAACVEAFEGSLGVYWGHASVVHAPEFFLQGMREADDRDEALPVELWTGFLRTQRDDGTADMYTDGLDVFGCMEFEIVASEKSPDDLFEMLMGMSRYVICQGSVFRDGDTVGASEGEKIVTRHADSVIGRPARVVLVDY